MSCWIRRYCGHWTTTCAWGRIAGGAEHTPQAAQCEAAQNAHSSTTQLRLPGPAQVPLPQPRDVRHVDTLGNTPIPASQAPATAYSHTRTAVAPSLVSTAHVGVSHHLLPPRSCSSQSPLHEERWGPQHRQHEPPQGAVRSRHGRTASCRTKHAPWSKEVRQLQPRRPHTSLARSR